MGNVLSLVRFPIDENIKELIFPYFAQYQGTSEDFYSHREKTIEEISTWEFLE